MSVKTCVMLGGRVICAAALLVMVTGCAGGRMKAERAAYHSENTELQEKLRQWQENTRDPWTLKYQYE